MPVTIGAPGYTSSCRRCRILKVLPQQPTKWLKCIRSLRITSEEVVLVGHIRRLQVKSSARARCSLEGRPKVLIRMLADRPWTVSSPRRTRRHADSTSQCSIQTSNRNCNCHQLLQLTCWRRRSKSIYKARRVCSLNIWSTRHSCTTITMSWRSRLAGSAN